MNQPRTERNGQIIKPEQPPKNGGNVKSAQMRAGSLEELLVMPETQQEIARSLPQGKAATDRMLRIYLTALRTTRNLIRCTTDSFLGCILQAGQLGLEPNTPLQQIFLIPRRNKKREEWERQKKMPAREIYECSLIVGYQGMIELSMRSRKLSAITAECVREGDYFKRRLGLNAVLDHEPSDDADRETKPVTYAWALAELTNGGKPWRSLSRAQIEARRARSSTPNEGPWMTDYEAMACKSAIRALWKVLPKSSEMAIADQLETAMDLGRSQRSVFHPDVHASLEALGIQPLADEDDDLGLGLLPVPDESTPLSQTLAEAERAANQQGEPAKRE